MWLLYLFSCIPLLIGFFLWIFNNRIHWIEWCWGTAAAFIVTGIIHASAIGGMTADTEVWSGRITKAVHYPEWIEEYQEAVYVTVTHTDSEGNVTTSTEFSHYETRHCTHHENWVAETDLDFSKDISEQFFKEISINFNNLTTEKPHKGGFDGGDPNIYVAYNKSGYIYPVTDTRHFSNRIKCAPTVFSYPKISPEMNKKLFDYPYPGNWLKSGRIIGEKNIDPVEFDRLNTRLGFKKEVNIIMINFGNNDSSIAQYQEAKFVGGKKNDLVICYGASTNGFAKWAYVFSWTEKDICKRNIETIMLTNKIDNSILPIIEKEVIRSYVRKDWNKFSYITIEPKPSIYIWYFVIMFITQGALYFWFLFNDIDKEQ